MEEFLHSYIVQCVTLYVCLHLMLEYCVCRFSFAGYGSHTFQLNRVTEVLTNVLQLTLNQNVYLSLKVTCKMYLSLKAEGNSPELAPGVPFFGQMTQRTVLDLSELLGAGSWSWHPSPGHPDKWGWCCCPAPRAPGLCPSPATGSRSLLPSHALSAFRLLCHSICCGKTARTEHLLLTGLVEILLWPKMSRLFLACVPAWLAWKVRRFAMESWAWVLRS